MAVPTSPDLVSLLDGKLRLPAALEDVKERYRNAQPFPHVVLDDLFFDRSLEPMLSEIGEMSKDQWVNVDRDPRERTVRMRSAAEMREAGAHILGIVHSAAFLYFLTEITGVRQLLPDPYLQGGGFAVMRRGDYFDVHADRSVAYETGLIRRLAMIIFLNKEWQRSYHGELELWSPDAKRADVAIEPLYNRTVLFEVAYPNFHGVPAPLACPPNRMRQSFIVYYHTVPAHGQEAVKSHTTIFAPRFYDKPAAMVRSVVREVMPPFLRRIARRFLD